jgi:hypothetical protein
MIFQGTVKSITGSKILHIFIILSFISRFSSVFKVHLSLDGYRKKLLKNVHVLAASESVLRDRGGLM